MIAYFVLLGMLLMAFISGLFFAMWWDARLKKRRGPFVSTESPCPGCGNRGSTLELELVTLGGGATPIPHIRHDCKTCKAKWYEPTVLEPKNWAPLAPLSPPWAL